MRGLVLVLLLTTGCKGLSGPAAEAIGHLAALATIGAAAAVGSAIAAEAGKAGDGVPVNSDVRYRRRCTGGRSYKLRCPTAAPCFWENNEGRAYECTSNGCKETPPELLRWCDDL